MNGYESMIDQFLLMFVPMNHVEGQTFSTLLFLAKQSCTLYPLSCLDINRDIPNEYNVQFFLDNNFINWQTFLKPLDPELNQAAAFNAWFFDRYYFKEVVKNYLKGKYDFESLKKNKDLKLTVKAIQNLEKSFSKASHIEFEALSLYATHFSVTYLKLLHKCYQHTVNNNNLMYYFDNYKQIRKIVIRHSSFSSLLIERKIVYSLLNDTEKMIVGDTNLEYITVFMRRDNKAMLNGILVEVRAEPYMTLNDYIYIYSITFNSRFWARIGFINLYGMDNGKTVSQIEIYYLKKIRRVVKYYLNKTRNRRFFHFGFSWSDSLSSRYIFKNKFSTVALDNYINMYRIYNVNKFVHYKNESNTMLYVGPNFKLLLGGVEYVLNPTSAHFASVGYFESKLFREIYNELSKDDNITYESDLKTEFNKTARVSSFLPCYVYDKHSARQVRCHAITFQLGLNYYFNLLLGKTIGLNGTPMAYLFSFLIEFFSIFNISSNRFFFYIHYLSIFTYTLLCNGSGIYYNNATIFFGNTSSGSFWMAAPRIKPNQDTIYNCYSISIIR